jgi:hypothetical protein
MSKLGMFQPPTPYQNYDLQMILWLRRRICLSVLTVASVVPTASAQIVEGRQYHGHDVTCVHSGIVHANGTFCGTQGYERVFTGTVKSAIDIEEPDKLLQLIPDEVFLGEPTSEVLAVTNQACLRREIRTGEKWLFYLSRNTLTNGLVLGYDSPSKPIAQAQADIARLRHLQRLNDSGLLTGTLTRIVSKNPWKSSPVPNRNVVIKPLSGKAEITAHTDGNGHYEVEVPPNSYTVSANAEVGLWAPEMTTWVSKGACIGVGFLLHTDGRILGTIIAADGKPARYAQIQIVPVSAEEQPFTVFADSDGHFEVGGREAGRYLVGAGASPEPGAQWQPSIYYPGVRDRSQAQAIELREGQWRAELKMKLPLGSSGP